MIERRVIVTPALEADAEDGFGWIHERNPAAARRFRGMVESAVLGLALSAERFAVIEAFAETGRDVRRALVGRRVKWRLYFEIKGGDVFVLHLRHPARADWTG